MWEVDYKESWAPKNWCFWTVVLEKTLESPLDCKEIKLVNPKENQPSIFIGRTDAEAVTPILWWPDAKNWLIWKDPDARKDRRQEEKRTEDEVVGWHHRLNAHEFEQTLGVGDGQGSLVCCSPWGHKELDMTEKLNWTELIHGDQLNKRKWMGYMYTYSWLTLLYGRKLTQHCKTTAAAAKLLQSCLTLCDPIGVWESPIPGILQARTLEWVAISFSNAWKWKVNVKLLSSVRLFVTPQTVASQASPSMGFFRQEYWSVLPFLSPCKTTICL